MKILFCAKTLRGSLRLTILLGAFSNADVAFGDLISTDKSGADNCHTFREAGYIQTYKGTKLTAANLSNGSYSVTREKKYNFRAPWAEPGSTTYEGVDCSEYIIHIYRNEPEGPSLGSMIDRLYGNVRSWMDSKKKRVRPEFIDRTYGMGYGGVRGSLGSSLWGFSLIEHSPDGAVGEVALTQAEINAGEKVFVLVDSKGAEDWLSLGVMNGFLNTNFFKRALADFETNQWYEIEVPASLLVEGTNTYTYFLNSAGDTNSSVFIALGAFEDLTPNISSFASTNGNFSMQLSNLVSDFVYTVEQADNSLANWQPALTLTASNEVETVSFPMTNSALFYRAAISPP